MVRIARALALLLCCAPVGLLAENAPDAGGGSGDDLKAIRQALDQQSRQIDVLAQEIARLNLLLQERGQTGGRVAEMPVEMPTETAAPAPAPEAAAPKAVVAEAVAEPKNTPAGPIHIVTKGETLTAIARHYKVTVPQLLKVNKIADVRKLQIGQTLVLPPGAKIPESPTPSPQPQ